MFFRRGETPSCGCGVGREVTLEVSLDVGFGKACKWRVLVVAPEDTVSGSKRPGMVMIDVALRKQPRATARGEF